MREETGIPRAAWRYFGHAGHLIVGRWCQFHLATQVGPWWVSTVGEYVPEESVREILAHSRGVTLEGRGDERTADYMRQIGFEEVGYQRKYETMVFRAGPPCAAPDCNCGIPLPTTWRELDMDGYNTVAAALAGHEEMCLRWAQRPNGTAEQPE